MGTQTEAGTDEASSTMWRYLTGVGVIVSIIGILAIFFPLVTSFALTGFLGALLVLGGIAHGIHVFTVRGWTGTLFQVLLALLYIVGGIGLIVNPVLGLLTLTLVLAVVFVLNGVFEVVMGYRLHEDHQTWGLIGSGILAIIIGVLIWVGWPSSAAWAIGLLFGINLLSSGLSMVLVGRAGRDPTRESASIGG